MFFRLFLLLFSYLLLVVRHLLLNALFPLFDQTNFEPLFKRLVSFFFFFLLGFPLFFFLSVLSIADTRSVTRA